MRAHRLLVLAVACAAALAGCAEQRAASEPPPEPKRQDRVLHYDLTIEGATPGRFTGDTPVVTVTLNDDRFPQFRWFGMETKEWLAIGDGRRAFVSLNVFGFRGDGSYTIPVSQLDGTAPPPRSGGEGLSNVRLRVVRGTGEDAPSQTYGIVVEPCSVTLERNGDAGELRCDRLRDPGGPRASLVLRWHVA